MQARWVIVGMFVVFGVYWLAMPLLFRYGADTGWLPYGVCAIAAFGAGALMVAHAPLRPWREPAVAGALAIAVVAALALAGPGLVPDWYIARALHPWYLGLGVAAVSGAMAGAGGIIVRRIATSTATARADLIVLLSALVIAGITGLAVIVSYALSIRTLVVVAGVAAGGFVTQAVIAPKRPWSCGAGGAILMVSTLARPGVSRGLSEIWTAISGGLVFIVIAYGGAQLAWWTLRRGDASSSPEIPPARLG